MFTHWTDTGFPNPSQWGLSNLPGAPQNTNIDIPPSNLNQLRFGFSNEDLAQRFGLDTSFQSQRFAPPTADVTRRLLDRLFPTLLRSILERLNLSKDNPETETKPETTSTETTPTTIAVDTTSTDATPATTTTETLAADDAATPTAASTQLAAPGPRAVAVEFSRVNAEGQTETLRSFSDGTAEITYSGGKGGTVTISMLRQSQVGDVSQGLAGVLEDLGFTPEERSKIAADLQAIGGPTNVLTPEDDARLFPNG
jgi:hypothetical protein